MLIAESKVGSCPSRAWSKSQQTVLLGCTIVSNLRDIKHIACILTREHTSALHAQQTVA